MKGHRRQGVGRARTRDDGTNAGHYTRCGGPVCDTGDGAHKVHGRAIALALLKIDVMRGGGGHRSTAVTESSAADGTRC